MSNVSPYAKIKNKQQGVHFRFRSKAATGTTLLSSPEKTSQLPHKDQHPNLMRDVNCRRGRQTEKGMLHTHRKNRLDSDQARTVRWPSSPDTAQRYYAWLTPRVISLHHVLTAHSIFRVAAVFVLDEGEPHPDVDFLPSIAPEAGIIRDEKIKHTPIVIWTS